MRKSRLEVCRGSDVDTREIRTGTIRMENLADANQGVFRITKRRFE